MRGTTSACTLVLFSLIAAAPAALAQNTDRTWSKTYSISNRASLSLETGDAQLQIRSCGHCQEIRISAASIGRQLSDFRLEESQSGNHVQFLFKEKSHMGFSIHVSGRERRATVSVEAPAELTLDAKTSDGNVELTGLRGELQLHSGDGHLDLNDLSGSLVLKSGDGHVRIANFNGNLDATVSDGGINVDGVFGGLNVRSSDGTVELTARQRSQPASPWNIKTSDGGVTIRLPKDLAADIDVHTSDGKIDSRLPLTVDRYTGEHEGLHGRMNGGGAPIIIKTNDGSVRIETD